jgi:hypothetical protein
MQPREGNREDRMQPATKRLAGILEQLATNVDLQQLRREERAVRTARSNGPVRVRDILLKILPCRLLGDSFLSSDRGSFLGGRLVSSDLLSGSLIGSATLGAAFGTGLGAAVGWSCGLRFGLWRGLGAALGSASARPSGSLWAQLLVPRAWVLPWARPSVKQGEENFKPTLSSAGRQAQATCFFKRQIFEVDTSRATPDLCLCLQPVRSF